ncbi:MAG TPA: type II toxin-antitoxin system VapC family toxin [Candidatus Acidoferrales bacterium]|nr:type II toxin-antitoxin system VapC family toxin [Candidatus Acidoferrales bacterium]
MTVFVLDASVAAKCVLPPKEEPLVAEALHLLEGYEKGDISFIVPDLFWAELGNVLWNAVRRKRITKTEAENALALMQARNFPTLPSPPLLGLALPMAIAHDRTVYDCLYVALASQIGAKLITADERLANSLGAYLPVQWLGML